MIEVLQKKKSAPILLTLLEEPRHVRGIQSVVGGSASTVGSRIQELKEEDLVKEEPMENWPYKKVLNLTDKGRDVATVFKELSGPARRRKLALMSFNERMKWPLMLINRLSEVNGITKMQKLLFLLNRKFGVEIPYDFTPYKHGPYCKDLDRDMSVLVDAGLVEKFEDFYTPTSEGKEMMSEISKDFPDEAGKAMDNLEKFNKMELRRLLNLVYTQYPEESGAEPEF